MKSEMQSVVMTMAMVVGQFVEVGMNTLVKAASSNGMSKYVFIFYSNALALCFLLPSSLLYHRKRVPPPISSSVICRLILASLLSCAAQTLMYTGVGLSSPTLASSMLDLVPAFTFILAVVSRMENLDLKVGSSQAKAIGTVVSITGALIVTLYKGLPIITFQSLPRQPLRWVLLSRPHPSTWLFGGFFLSLSTLCISVRVIVETWILKDYPAELMMTTITCGFVVLLSAIVALIVEGNSSKAWILRPDIELVAIFYKAIFMISMRSVVHAWACRKKGPVYASMFNPLGMVIALGMGIIFLRDTLYLGSMIGAAVIATGFYAVMWGLAQEEKMVSEKRRKKNEICSSVSSSATTPLLQNKTMDV